MSAEMQMILGLVIGIISLIFMLLKSKIHVFLALIMTALITGIVGGMNPVDVVAATKTGFGNTLGNLGILIMFGIMLGKILEVSGATDAIANFLIEALGEGREHIALLITGFVTSMAIFCVPAYVMLFPIAKNIAVKKRIPLSKLGVALAGGLFLSHTFVPPASGPIGAAGIFNANIVSVMLWGTLMAAILFVMFVFYTNYIGKKFNDIPDMDDIEEIETRELPSVGAAFAPIITPIVLIIASTLLKLQGIEGAWAHAVEFAGQPMIALGIGVLLSIVLLTKTMDRNHVLAAFDRGIAEGAKILLMVGAGGALGNVVNASGAGKFIAESIAATAIPPILLPFIIATVLRIIQGSGSVATITAASISAPILATIGVDPVLGTLAASAGSVFFSYFNDSYFWTIQESMDFTDVKDQVWIWSYPTTISWALSLIYILVLGRIM